MSFSSAEFWLQLAGMIAALGVVYGGLRVELRVLGERVGRLEDRIDGQSRIMAYIKETMPADFDDRPIGRRR